MKIKGNIIAHRGIFNNIDVPENSLSAFKKALHLDTPIELDVQLTKDNVLVVFHDDNLERMTGKDSILQDLTFNEIKDLKLLNTNEKIPLFRQVLKLFNNKLMIDIEIKNTKRIKDTCDILMSELSNYDNYIIKSFNPNIIRYIKKSYPDVEVGLLINNKYDNFILNYILHTKFIIRYSKADFISISKKLLKTKKFKSISNKYKTLVWTVKKKDEINNDDIIYICNNLPFKE